jgi:dihydroxyacetone kinase-like predicted kinase
VLACDRELTAVAEQAATSARADGQEVVVVPTSSVPQGLAALAVHDPERRAGDDVVAMAEAAAGTRTGGLVLAESEALTWVGRCAPGEVLGLSDGEVVLIAPDLNVGALWLAHRMLTPGGELVTALLGAEADEELGTRLADDLRRTHPEVDVAVFRGGQTDFPLVLGVE